jgi:serpin B
MEEVLGGGMEELAEASNTLAQLLAVVGDAEREEDDDEAPEPARASLVNGVWLQQGFEVQDAYLEDLATWFGAGVAEADFAEEAGREEAREEINSWVADSTDDLIEELIPEDVLRPETRLVLVNALHLRAAWPQELATGGGTFTTAEGDEVSTETLHGSTTSWYEDAACRATSLGTHGGELALALVQPVGEVSEVLDAWSTAAADSDTDSAGLGALLAGLESTAAQVQLTVPGFDIGWDASLKETLEELGMVDAFSDEADFSGVTGAADLVITEVLQKAVITVDEQGMEAAAATAVIASETSVQIPDQELVLDAPFLFVAYHRESLAPLVLGWIGDPTQTR